jgi:hypothetical protein
VNGRECCARGEIPKIFHLSIAPRAGLFARFEEQFAQMTRAITKICMQIVVTSYHRIFFAISREKMTRPTGIEFLVKNPFSTPSSPTAPRAPS